VGSLSANLENSSTERPRSEAIFLKIDPTEWHGIPYNSASFEAQCDLPDPAGPLMVISRLSKDLKESTTHNLSSKIK
jgi:hypothetical protein